MRTLILLLLLSSCGNKNEEQEVDSSMCLDKCVSINLKKVNQNENDASRLCTDFVLPKVKCYTMNNETFYYR